MDDVSEQLEPQPTEKSFRFRKWLLLLVCGVISSLIFLHWVQPDWLVPVTMVPCWMWLVPSFLLLVFGLRGTSRRLQVSTLILILVFAGLFVEEVRSLTRIAKFQEAKSPDVLRVVTLNCNIGSVAAAREVIELQPDVVLFQESPSREELQKLSAEMYGDAAVVIYSTDASLITGFPVSDVFDPNDGHFVSTVLQTPSAQLRVVSTRLSAPVYRLDFWQGSFWKQHAKCRQDHRRQLQEIADHLQKDRESGRAVVLAGDFNSVPRDGAFSPFAGWLQDQFFVAGKGLGGTGTNEIPLFRVDQVWATSMQANIAVAKKTIHSDHRMVVVDFDWQ